MFDKIINTFLERFAPRAFYVIADAGDNSITLSRALFRHMGIMRRSDEAKVFVFRIPYHREYGFTLNPHLDEPTQLADVQYNSKYRCIGFETLNPTVNRIAYDYGLPALARYKFTVQVCRVHDLVYYKICRPKNEKHPR